VAYAPHMRLTMSGTLGATPGPPEIFSTSFAIADPAGFPTPALATRARLQAVTDAIIGRWSNAALGIAAQAILRQVKVAYVLADGKVGLRSDGSYDQEVFVTGNNGVPGGGGAMIYPFQVSLVATLAVGLGAGVPRGRMYLPLPTHVVQPNGRILDAAAQGSATQVAGLLSDIAAALTAEGQRVAVASQGNVLRGLPPNNQQVVSVRVGNVLDTIRSRRNALDEVYKSASV
jgi:hypothetical protein